MKYLNILKKKILNDETRKIFMYIISKLKYVFLFEFIVISVLIIFSLLIGKLDDIIITSDLKYNSPVFRYLGACFIAAILIVFSYGIYLCINSYERPGYKGRKKIYSDGTSYKALHDVLVDNVINRK